MVTGAPIEMHGVTGNDWERDNSLHQPAARNPLDFFPMFDVIREQKPDAKMYAYIGGERHTYDMTVFDKALYSNKEKGYSADELLQHLPIIWPTNLNCCLYPSTSLITRVMKPATKAEYFDCIAIWTNRWASL